MLQTDWGGSRWRWTDPVCLVILGTPHDYTRSLSYFISSQKCIPANVHGPSTQKMPLISIAEGEERCFFHKLEGKNDVFLLFPMSRIRKERTLYIAGQCHLH